MSLESLPLTTIGVIIIAAIGLSILMKRLGQNPVLGFILAGFVLGPFFLKFLHPEEALVKGFAEMGLFILLFYLGLELSIKDFLEAGSATLGLALIDIIGLMAIGAGTALLFGFSPIFAFAIGVMMFSTSTAIVGKFTLDNSLLQKPNVKLSVSILILQDFLGILFVVFITSFSHGSSPFSLALRAIVFAVAAFYVVFQLSKKVEHWLEKHDFGHTEVTLYALGIGLVVATLASSLSLSTAIGAYFAGFALAATRAGDKIKKDINFLRDFFLLFFFVGFGTTIFFDLQANSIIVPTTENLAFFGGIALLLAGGIIAINTIVFVLFGPLFGVTKEDSVLSGLLLVPLGEFVVIIGTEARKVIPAQEATAMPIISFLIIVLTVILFQPLYRMLPKIQKAVSVLPEVFRIRQSETKIKPETPFTAQQLRKIGTNMLVLASMAWIAMLLFEELPEFSIPVLYSREATTIIVFALFAVFPVFETVRAVKKILKYHSHKNSIA